jgi:hypothetical protein
MITSYNSQYTLCIVYPGGNAYSETFIRAHIERLPARVVLLAQGWYNGTTTPVLPKPFLFGLKGMRVLARDTGFPASLVQKLDTLALTRFFKRNHVDVVLAEYGMAGAQIADACVQAGIPLVVHFHGHDAYNEPLVLHAYREQYRRLFAVASAIIAVSQDMEQQLMSLGAPRNKLFYNVYGVDTTLFALSKPADNPPLFVAVGRFVNKKSPPYNFAGISQSCASLPGCTTGDDWRRSVVGILQHAGQSPAHRESGDIYRPTTSRRGSSDDAQSTRFCPTFTTSTGKRRLRGNARSGAGSRGSRLAGCQHTACGY